MLIRETVSNALNNIRMSKMRSALTMLGVIIGISAVIIIASIGTGESHMFKKAFGKMGQKTLIIGENNNYTGKIPIPYELASFSSEDINFLKKNPNIQYISPIEQIGGNSIHILEHKIDRNRGIKFQGIEPDYLKIVGRRLVKGRCFPINTKIYYTVIGNSLAEKLFRNEDPLGKMITFNINSRSNGYKGVYTFKVIGVVENPSAEFAKLSGTEDMSQYLVYIPANPYLQITGNKHLGFAYTTIKDSANLDMVREQLINSVAKLKDLPAAMFQARPVNMWISDQSQTMESDNIFLMLIASISLLVGGIGIMNIMLVTVSERTREIGIRKALGATNNNILIQFLIEAVILTLIGGLIGIVLGYGCSFIVGDIVHIPPILNWSVVFISALISIGVGILFGVFPARKAALLNPIDALRHE
ncbi:MAG TPA: ABC transporter permease [Victivallales bacterium]|nr:ABC transporter permease [Victivallales bacterium]